MFFFILHRLSENVNPIIIKEVCGFDTKYKMQILLSRHTSMRRR